jgi:hypothetical protein
MKFFSKRRGKVKSRHRPKDNKSRTESPADTSTGGTGIRISHSSDIANSDHKENHHKCSPQYDRSKIEKEIYDFYHRIHDPAVNAIDTSKVSNKSGCNGGNKDKNEVSDADDNGGSNNNNNSYSNANNHSSCNMEQSVDVEFEFDPAIDNGTYAGSNVEDFSILQREVPSQVNIKIDILNMNMKMKSLLGDVETDSLKDDITNDDLLFTENENSSQVSKVKVESALEVQDETEKENHFIDTASLVNEKIFMDHTNTKMYTNTKEIHEKLLINKEKMMMELLLVPKEIQFVNEDEMSTSSFVSKLSTTGIMYTQTNHGRIDTAKDMGPFLQKDSSRISDLKETETTTSPSIAFFLGANRQDLQKEKKSFTENETEYGKCTSPSTRCSHTSTLKLKPHLLLRDWSQKAENSDSNANNNTKSTNSNINAKEDDDTKTTRGMSLASSKYTNATPKVLELREKKRLMERRFEAKYSILPSMIQVAMKNTTRRFRRHDN